MWEKKMKALNHHSKIMYGKDLLQLIDEEVDEQVFWEFKKNYLELLQQLKPLEKFTATTSHAILMDYLTNSIITDRDEELQSKLNV